VAVTTDLDKLRRFNAVMGLVHLVQAIVMLVLSSDFSLPVTTAFQKFDPASGRLVSDFRTGFDLRLGPLIAGFLLLSALAHLAVATGPGFRWYSANLRHHINPARWIEYSLSSSLMIVAIAMLVGIYDVVALLALFAVNAGMILFGWMMELHNQTTDRTRWTAYWFGVILGVVPWIGVAIYLIGAAGSDPGPPAFVYWIFFSIFVFFNVFAVNMVLQYKKVGRWRDYLYGERAYILLSLFAKSALAWQVFAGTLRPV
jgi:hypothetical protein